MASPDEPPAEVKAEVKADPVKPPAKDPVTGHFLPGNRLSVGHKPSPATTQRRNLHRQFLAAVGSDRLLELIDHGFDIMLETKRAKDLAPLMSLYFAYLFGKPQEFLSLDVSAQQPHSPTALPLDAIDIAALETIRRKVITQSPEGDRCDDDDPNIT